MSLLDETQECLFCGKPKRWRSVLIGLDPKTSKKPLFIVTVCPACRKAHTIEEMYETAIMKFSEKIRAYLETCRMEQVALIFTIPKIKKGRQEE